MHILFECLLCSIESSVGVDAQRQRYEGSSLKQVPGRGSWCAPLRLHLLWARAGNLPMLGSERVEGYRLGHGTARIGIVRKEV